MDMELLMELMEQLDDASDKGLAFVNDIKDYDESVAFAVLATCVDKYCEVKGLNVKDTWNRLYTMSKIVNG